MQQNAGVVEGRRAHIRATSVDRELKFNKIAL
jgi:hypothetical protein